MKSPEQIKIALVIADLQVRLGPLCGKSPEQIQLDKEIAELEAKIVGIIEGKKP